MVTETSSGMAWVLLAATEQGLQAYAHSREAENQTVSDVVTDGWLGKIRSEVYKHPQVEELYVSISNELLVDYWIVIPHRDIALVRTLVEDQRQNIIGLFARTPNPPFQVDFHICYREGRPARELVPSDATLIPKF